MMAVPVEKATACKTKDEVTAPAKVKATVPAVKAKAVVPAKVVVKKK